jgi:hypothetical protein
MLIAVNPVGAQQSVISNQDVILHVISEHLQTEIPPDLVKDTVAIRLPDATDQSLQAFQNMLFKTGLNVSSSYSNTKNITFVFNLMNELIRSTKSEYNRHLKGTIGVNIVSTEGVIIWSTIIDIDHLDLITKSEIDNMTTDWKPSGFVKIENRRRGLRFLKLVEPVIISSAVITTAYLLYNVRSN